MTKEDYKYLMKVKEQLLYCITQNVCNKCKYCDDKPGRVKLDLRKVVNIFHGSGWNPHTTRTIKRFYKIEDVKKKLCE